ncbi:MAG: hypothetical protein O2822_08715, partial [Chloroflexi bacterium]|nr:hypothetical protein [Chloroflexota bacterium]
RVAAGLSRAALVALALAAGLALTWPSSRAQAQPATVQISGAITSGTAGVALGSVQVRLIVLEGARVVEAVTATVNGSRYSATVPLVAGRLLVPHATYEGVEYFGDPITLAETTPEATRDFRVYATTREAPDLAIASSTITVVAIDREAGKIGLLREDMVANPGDRVFLGDASGITLRLPAPTGTVEATGDSTEGTFAFERGVVTTTLPIRPGRLTSIVTRYVVDYDREADEYALRLTAPVPAERLTVRVPEGFVRAIRPEAGAVRADDERLSGQGEGEVLQIVRATAPVRPGGGVVVNLIGLSGPAVRVNPLTQRNGAAMASLLALAIVGGGTALAWRARGRLA